jgi:hypothetical protein
MLFKSLNRVIPVPRRLKQEDQEFKASLNYNNKTKLKHKVTI